MQLDTIIFDMDGTLWDATSSYAKLWNLCSDEMGVTKRISPSMLIDMMGSTIDVIFDRLLPEIKDFARKTYLQRLNSIEEEMMGELGGVLYPGVYQGLELLSQKYRLMMVSNCGAKGLKNFMDFTNTHKFFIDFLTNGQTGLPKSENIRILCEKHHVKNGMYVGDTQHDCDEAHKANLLFGFAAYGFGNCTNPDYTFNDFTQIVNFLTNGTIQ